MTTDPLSDLMADLERRRSIELTDDQIAKLNRWERAAYHSFNKHGLISRDLEALSDRINRAIADGHVVSGFWLVYGSFGYHGEALMKMASRSRTKKLTVWEVNYHIEKLREQIATGHRLLDEKGAAK